MLISNVMAFFLHNTIRMLASLLERAGTCVEVTDGAVEGVTKELPTPVATEAIEDQTKALEAEQVVT